MKATIVKRYELLPNVFIETGEAEVDEELYAKLYEGNYLNVKPINKKKNGTNNRNHKRD